jgi:S-adenosylmethionine hydrolase
VHAVVVDPGVGTARHRVAIRAGGHDFVGPDNGCLSGALEPESRGRRRPDERYEARPVQLPAGVRAYAIEDDALLLPSVSATFEGRDVFAPVAAYLARGGDIASVGPRIETLQAFPAFRAPATPDGIEGIVIRLDRFENLITDVRAADVKGARAAMVAGRTVPIVRTYADVRELCALEGSAGFIEIALPNGSAALTLGVGPGDRVLIERAPSV